MKYFLIIAFLMLSKHSNSCDCVEIKGLKESKLVFKGKVMKVERIEDSTITYYITFNIYHTIKGKVKGNSIIIKTPCLVDGCCGIPFEVNDEYMVNSYIRNGYLFTNLCTLTRKLDKKKST